MFHGSPRRRGLKQVRKGGLNTTSVQVELGDMCGYATRMVWCLGVCWYDGRMRSCVLSAQSLLLLRQK